MAPSHDALNGITVTTDARGIATVKLDQPEIHKTFDDAMISTLNRPLHDLDDDAEVRVVVLDAICRRFSAPKRR